MESLLQKAEYFILFVTHGIHTLMGSCFTKIFHIIPLSLSNDLKDGRIRSKDCGSK